MAKENVYLFYANIIGYCRVITAILSFWFMPTCWKTASFFYLLSAILDAVDGPVARAYGQSSKFGAMLDMLTDRCATMCLLVVLAHFYSRWMLAFQLSAAIDIWSHWLHMHAAMMAGKTSHKTIDQAKNPILHLYYTSRKFLFFMCAGNELFYTMLYICYFESGPIVLGGLGLFQLICVVCFPIMFVKTVISVVHLVTASQTMVEIDENERAQQSTKLK